MQALSRLNLRILKLTGIKASFPVFIDGGFKCLYPRNISIGAYVSLGHDNHIWAFDKVSIGNYTQTAKDLLIIAGSHDTGSLRPLSSQQVVIGSGCWIGARVTIIGGVSIGKGVIIGAGSLVNKDIPDFAIAAGNPAKIIRFRNPDDVQWNPFKSFSIHELS
ncbi:acyltransferase [Mucilaginibacter sp. dw_454]|uniref:acyltransferase n=1 Tax=Mucilaginibacter sp. dw_454 TaxID=2720079 RepID=UPI0021082089|nr:acyltransferase [Mucilaginibacter sp. dw_454]